MLRRKEMTTIIIIVSTNNYMYIKKRIWVHKLSNLEEGEFYDQEAQKKFRTPGENWTHDPLSSSSDSLTTKLLEALWRAGSKFNHNYALVIELVQ